MTNFYPFIYGLGSLKILLSSTNLFTRTKEIFFWILLDFFFSSFLFSSVHYIYGRCGYNFLTHSIAVLYTHIKFLCNMIRALLRINLRSRSLILCLFCPIFYFLTNFNNGICIAVTIRQFCFILSSKFTNLRMIHEKTFFFLCNLKLMIEKLHKSLIFLNLTLKLHMIAMTKVLKNRIRVFLA